MGTFVSIQGTHVPINRATSNSSETLLVEKFDSLDDVTKIFLMQQALKRLEENNNAKV